MSNISIRDYVKSLDYDQLTTLLEVANAKKAEKDDEARLYVHSVVYGGWQATSFREGDLAGAVEFLHQKMLEVVNSGDDLKKKVEKLKEIELRHKRERVSEYEQWFE